VFAAAKSNISPSLGVRIPSNTIHCPWGRSPAISHEKGLVSMKTNESNAQNTANDRKLHAEVPGQSSPEVTSNKPDPKKKKRVLVQRSVPSRL
jgi:hypothetical protein